MVRGPPTAGGRNTARSLQAVVHTGASLTEHRPQHSRQLSRRLAAIFFVDLGGLGAWAPFVGLHLQRQGHDGVVIGGLLALVPVVRMLSAPAWAGLADRSGSTVRLLTVAMSLSVLAAAAVAFGPPSAAILALGLGAVAALRAPVAPLLDATALDVVVRSGRPPGDYGRLRLWGTVGFLVVTAVAALSVDRSATAAPALGMAVACWALSAAMTRGLPAPPPAPPVRLGPALRRFAASPFLAPLLVALVLHGFGLTLYDSLVAVHLQARGLGGQGIAVALVLGLLVEIAVMARGTVLLDRVGAFRLLVIAAAGAALRWGLTATVTTPWLLVGVQALHGVSFGAYWIAAVEVMRRHAPPELQASAQALLTASSYGVGAVLSSLAIAALLDSHGTPALFGVATVTAGLATLGLVVAGRRRPRDATAAG